MGSFVSDLRYGVRSLLRAPGFTLVAVLTLALGIGANSSIYTVVNAVVLRSLPYADGDRLVVLNETDKKFNSSCSYPNFQDWAQQQTVFEDMAAFRMTSHNITGLDRPIRARGQEASAELFSLFQLQPAAGQFFTADADKRGGEKVAVISYGFWAEKYGEDPGVVDRTVQLSGVPHRIVGVAPPGFDFPGWGSPVEIWTPIEQHEEEWFWRRGNHPGIYVIAKRNEGVSVEAASAGMETVAAALREQYPKSNSSDYIRVTDAAELLIGDLRAPMLLLLGGVGLVLLIACANVSNLLLARSAARTGEVAVRSALGAGRWRLARQYLAESVILAAAGGALGVVLALWGTRWLVDSLPPGTPRASEIAVDWSTLAFTGAATLLVALLAGMAPAIQHSRSSMNDALRSGSRGGTALGGRQRLRKALIVTEVALATVLLVGSALLMRSFWNVVDANPGFDPNQLLTARISLPEAEYEDDVARLGFVREFVRRAEQLPGVQYAGVGNPLLGGYQQAAYIEGTEPPPPGDYTPVDYARVTRNHLRALGVRLLRGRHFDETDEVEGVRSLIVDETFAEQYWPEQDPIGKRVLVGGFPDDDTPINPEDWSTVVGVISHIKNYGVDQDSRIEMYIPYTERAVSSFTLTLRTTTDPESAAEPLRGIIREIDANLPVYGVESMRTLLGDTLAPRRIGAVLMAAFAAFALLLASLGIYGVMAFSVNQSVPEMGLRMAMGAQRRDVVTLIVGRAIRLVGLGLAIGVAGALAVSRLLESQLFEVSPLDAVSYGAVMLALIVAGLAAVYAPARRATSVDPMRALRYE